MSKQDIVDILGVVVLWGCGLCALLLEIFPPATIYVFIVLCVICCIRVYLFRTIPKKERRIYEDMELFYGKDQLFHPYTQTAFMLVVLALIIYSFITE
jgi:uncharacterized membrane protein